MAKSKVKKVNVKATMVDIDLESTALIDVGMLSITMKAIADFSFLEKLVAFVIDHTEEPKEKAKP